jgi:2-polyprenyl-3-methyl-5-hydroxy-6-metoxy-1,4-benzoquinol methylase
MAHLQVKDYGWTIGQSVPSNGYLEPAVVNACRRLGVSSVLDLGCGKGDIAKALFRSGFDVMGCDADAEGVRIAAESSPQIKFSHLGVYDEPGALGRSGFDAVVSTEVIEHLFTPRALPRFANSVIKEGGWLIITTPYHGYLKNLALAVTGHWDLHLSPLWDGGHIKFFSRRMLTQLLEEEGFEVLKFQGIGRLPYLWKSMLLVARKMRSASS